MLECENWVQDFMGMKWATRELSKVRIKKS
jgi:hypothetical protein